MNLSVMRFGGACVAALSAAVSLTACGSPEEQPATPEKTVVISAKPGAPNKQWASSTRASPARPYAQLCLRNLWAPGPDGKIANFDAVGTLGDDVVGIIANPAGAADKDHFGLVIVPASGTGNQIVRFNLDTETANALLVTHGIC